MATLESQVRNLEAYLDYIAMHEHSKGLTIVIGSPLELNIRAMYIRGLK